MEPEGLLPCSQDSDSEPDESSRLLSPYFYNIISNIIVLSLGLPSSLPLKLSTKNLYTYPIFPLLAT